MAGHTAYDDPEDVVNRRERVSKTAANAVKPELIECVLQRRGSSHCINYLGIRDDLRGVAIVCLTRVLVS